MIEAEVELVQDLRTRFTIAKAFQDELDTRTHGRELEFANTTIQQMASDHRYGLGARVSGWIRSVTVAGGFVDQVAASDLSELRSSVNPDEYVPVIGPATVDPFRELFPSLAAGTVPSSSDFEPIRARLLAKAREVLANADAIRQHYEGATATDLVPVSLDKVNEVLVGAERLLNNLSICVAGQEYGFSRDLASPDPTSAARDLVDLELIGTFDRLVAATGANKRLGASGMWWWQYREDFWRAVDEAAERDPARPINAQAFIWGASSSARPLTTPQIERLVARYRLEYARYDATSRSVEDKVRKMLDSARVKALISSRAKDPKSLSKKLERKRAKYQFADLDADLGAVVTDLAGVRVILYDDQDSDRVASLIKEAWKGCADEAHDAQYKARHLTVVLEEPESRSIDGARCEIQLASLASHPFNELEHDIGYKNQDVPAGAAVQQKLAVLGQSTAGLQLAIRELLAAREQELGAQKSELARGTDLGAVLDRVFSRRVTGDLDALAYLWQGLEKQPLTPTLVEQQAPDLLTRGRSLALDVADANPDDATAIAFALWADSRSEAADIARDYPDQDSAMIRAILELSGPEHA